MLDVAGTIREGADAFVRRQYTTIAVLALVGVGDHRRRHRVGRDARRSPTCRASPGIPIGVLTGIRVPGRGGLLGALGLHRHVRSPSAPTCAPRPRPRRSLVEAVQVALRGGAVSGFLVVALRLLGVLGIFVAYQLLLGGQIAVAGAVPDRRLRLRRQLRRPVRPARRRHLHQGRRRRRRPRRQGRGGHPRRRPAQRGA